MKAHTEDILTEKVAEIIYSITGGDSAFDTEGGYWPVWDTCMEKAEEIVELFIKEVTISGG